MTDKLKPTNQEIIDYIFSWIEDLDGHGLIITDCDLIKSQLGTGRQVNFYILREMFTAHLYNSILEYVNNE